MPGTRTTMVDIDFMSHIFWTKGVRDKWWVGPPRILNFFRKLLGLKRIRGYTGRDTQLCAGWHNPCVNIKINGRKHRIYCYSNDGAEQIYNYFMDCKNFPDKFIKIPDVNVKDYDSYDC
jgi:hypothetical protein